MNPQRQKVLDALERLQIPYRLEEHPAVYTIEEIEREEGLQGKESIVKNLFLRNAKGNQHYLVLLRGEKNADLKALQQQIGSSRLSFGSPQRLMDQLGVTPGSVSPMGLLNNADHALMVLIDEELCQMGELGVHPNENTATLFLQYSDLLRFLQFCRNPVQIVPIVAR